MAKHFADGAVQLAPLQGDHHCEAVLYILMSRPSTNGIQVAFSNIL